MQCDKSKIDIEKEKHEFVMRFFDYAESPIKEWIAAQIGESPTIVFDDYNDESDIFGVMDGNNHYNLYLTPFPTVIDAPGLSSNPVNSPGLSSNPINAPGLSNPISTASAAGLLSNPISTAFMIPKRDVETCEDLRKAMSMIHDSVYTVYNPVIKTMSHMNHLMEDMFPIFDEKTMSFSFRMANKYAMEHKKVTDGIKQAEIQLARLNLFFERMPNSDAMNQSDKDKYTQALEMKTQLNEIIEKSNAELEKIKPEDIIEQDTKCNEVNSRPSARLYIVGEKNIKSSEESIMKKLPKIATLYQDPDEDTNIDLLKKEYDVKP
jgi:hypothetical protein